MPIVFNKFNCFVEDVAEKKHNLSSDLLTIALTDTLPLDTNTVIGNITEISYTYCSARVPTILSSAQVAGIYKLILQQLTLTASGGTVGPFRYIVLYNNTSAGKELICWYDYGESITLKDTETLDLEFDETNGVLTLG